MRYYWHIACATIVATLMGCGTTADPIHSSVSTQLLPFIVATEPATVSTGDTLTLFGFGFSSHENANIAITGDDTIFASNYTLVSGRDDGAIESLDITIPAAAAAGDSTLLLQVFNNTSNVHTITITP